MWKADRNWMDEEKTPDLVEDDDDAAVTARIMMVNSMAVTAEVNYEEETM